MRILVIGSGAREHALCRSLAADPAVTALACAPGNAGTVALAEPFDCDLRDPAAVAGLALAWRADLVVIGPEVPLVAGAADAVRAAGIDCFGPSAAAAALEGSKDYAKQVMAVAGVPTAASRTCTSTAEVAAALDAFGPPYVVKDDALAAGKGVVVTDDRQAALDHAAGCLGSHHAPGRDQVVVEEYLDGPEVSLFAVCDGTTVLPLVPAQDFKRVGDGDAGPNTGGMGAYSPLPWAPPDLVEQVLASVLQPTVDEMARRGTPFSGLLYAGLALTSDGVRVVEFNVRFGDPETQVVLARLTTPMAGLLQAAAQGRLASLPPLSWSDDSAVTVVIAAPGYPGTPLIGDEVVGADHPQVLHAGTRLVGGRIISAGGRVLSVLGTGPDLAAARADAYAVVDQVSLVGSHHRTDIALAAAQGSGQV